MFVLLCIPFILITTVTGIRFIASTEQMSCGNMTAWDNMESQNHAGYMFYCREELVFDETLATSSVVELFGES